MPHIDYESQGFPAGAPVPNGHATIDVSWDDLLWAALTVGRPNRQAVFQHGRASRYEAAFRRSLVRMALEQSGPAGQRFRRTTAARTLDPTEKGAVNYFIGMTLCKVFADKLLSAPWMLHLDVFRPTLNPVLTGRSRPDLVGQRVTGEWISVEAKGRISAPDANAKARAKQQARRCVSIRGAVLQYHIGGIAYLKSDVLRFYWCDPEPERTQGGRAIVIDPDPAVWYFHYALPLSLIRDGQQVTDTASSDVEVSAHPEVLALLQREQFAQAKEWCDRNGDSLTAAGFRKDGLRVVAGRSWLEPFVDRIAESQLEQWSKVAIQRPQTPPGGPQT
jgi:hypothetical protein